MKLTQTEVQEERKCSPGCLELQVLLLLSATCHENRHVPPHPGLPALSEARTPSTEPFPYLCFENPRFCLGVLARAYNLSTGKIDTRLLGLAGLARPSSQISKP